MTYIPKHFADWRKVPSQALERRELRDALIKALESLPEKYREILRTRLSRARPQVARHNCGAMRDFGARSVQEDKMGTPADLVR